MKKTKEVFDEWNKEKKEIEFLKNKIKKVKKGEIWLSKIGINIGSEVSKDGDFIRPMLIVSNHMGGDLVGAIPITTKYNEKYDKFLYKIINYKKYGLKRESYLCLNQFKIMSMRRCIFRINGFYRGNNKKSLILSSFIDKILDLIGKLLKKTP